MGRSSLCVFLFVLAGCVGDAAVTTPPGGDAATTNDGGANPDAAPTALTIPTLRDPQAAGHPAVGTRVRVEGVVVTGVKNVGVARGFFVQDPSASTWAGIYVFTGATDVSVSVGAIVTVTGKLVLYRGLDQLDATGGTYVATGTATVPPPVDVTPNEIREGSPTSAQYQSMLLRVKGVKAKTGTTGVDFTVVSSAGNDDLVVTSFMAADFGASPFPATPNQTFSSIVGRGYRYGPNDQTSVAKLAPMNAGEVVTP